MKWLILIVISIFVYESCFFNYEEVGFTGPVYRSYRKYNRNIPEDYLLAMVPIHECINTHPDDAEYIIAATWNRVLTNHGRYGRTVREQILSPEFKGLISESFTFDSLNSKHIRCLKLARKIMRSDTLTHGGILGWYTEKSTNRKFLRKVKYRTVKTNTYHTFWN